MTVGLGMSDFVGLRSGGILDASRWHDRLITKTRLCKSELTFHFIMSYALVSGSLPNLWVMLSRPNDGRVIIRYCRGMKGTAMLSAKRLPNWPLRRHQPCAFAVTIRSASQRTRTSPINKRSPSD